MKCYFFGTFNPVHIGHIEIAKFIEKEKKYGEVIFVPAYNPPHKKVLNYKDRVNMLKINNLKVNEIESRQEGVTYTYKIIEKLGKCYFIIGYDAFLEIETWKNPEYLKENLYFLVLPRKTVKNLNEFEKLKQKRYNFEILNFEQIDISSEEIRRKKANKESLNGLVTKETEKYINEHRLYETMA